MDWRDIVNNLHLWYMEFVDWYLVQPIYGQILTIVGIIAILALVITVVYYIIKGIAYLVYYILKGTYYLLKGIGLGFFKLSEGLYYLVSGEQNPKKQTKNDNCKTNLEVNKTILYCSECGIRLSVKMINQMFSSNIAYCVNCGKALKLVKYQEPLVPAQ